MRSNRRIIKLLASHPAYFMFTKIFTHSSNCCLSLKIPFSLSCAWTNSWVNTRDACNLRRHHAHNDITVMWFFPHSCRDIWLLTCNECQISHCSWKYWKYYFWWLLYHMWKFLLGLCLMGTAKRNCHCERISHDHALCDSLIFSSPLFISTISLVIGRGSTKAFAIHSNAS